MNNKILKAPDFDDMLREELKDPEFKRLFDEAGEQLEIAYKLNHLRILKKMSQAELARKAGMTQSNIARLISGNQNFTIQTLSRVAKALGAELTVAIK